MSGETHLARISLDRRATIRAAARGRARSADPGYLLHSALSLVFASSDEPAEVPFSCYAWDDLREQNMSWQDRGRMLPLLAYAACDADALRSRMGHPDLVQSLETKRAPELPVGASCGFRVRVCPVVRTRRGADGVSRGRKVKSRELDAFTHAQIEQPDITRDEAYAQWLRKQLAEAAEVTQCGVTELRTDRMHRKGGGPFAHSNVVLEGTVQVTDAAAFSAVLARGVGRHRTFGFGMLLLRPAR